MSVTLLSPPIVEPVSLPEIKAYLKLEHDLEDDMLRAFINAARVHLEHLTGRHFISQSWRMLLEGPLAAKVALPLQPIISIQSAAILSDEGELIALATEGFSIYQDKDPATLLNINGLVAGAGQRLQLDIETGFGPTAEYVPEPLKLSIKMVVAEWYERRLIADPSQLPSLAASLQPLISAYRSIRL